MGRAGRSTNPSRVVGYGPDMDDDDFSSPVNGVALGLVISLVMWAVGIGLWMWLR